MKIQKLILFFLFLSAYAICATPEIIKFSDIKEGMKGWGLTVFKGTTPEKFNVNVVDKIEKFTGTINVILVRCEKTDGTPFHLAMGMSGSPIYLDNKLAGAISFLWESSLEPIAGVTPIEQMMDESENLSAINSSKDIPLRAISIPLIFNGFSGGAVKRASSSLNKFNITAAESGGVSRDDAQGKQLKDGDSLAISLLKGDMAVFAVGTTTMVDGDKVISFGHQFMDGLGKDLPLHFAKIHTIIPSQKASMKLASILGDSIGAVVSDNPTGVIGKLNKKSQLVPVEVSIKEGNLSKERKYRVEVVNNKIVTPTLVDAFFETCFMMGARKGVGNTIDAKASIKFKNYSEINFDEAIFSSESIYNNSIATTLAVLMTNPFKDIELEKIKLDAVIVHENNVAEIKKIWIENAKIERGKRYKLNALLDVYGQKKVTVSMDIEIPSYIYTGKIKITVTNGAAAPLTLPNFQTIDDIFKEISQRYSSRYLYATIELPEKAIGYRGEILPFFPKTIENMITSLPTVSASLVGSSIRHATKTEYIINGSQILELNIK